MENPCLTFVTPTLLAGDRSLADVVAHEIAHRYVQTLGMNSLYFCRKLLTYNSNRLVFQLDRKFGY